MPLQKIYNEAAAETRWWLVDVVTSSPKRGGDDLWVGFEHESRAILVEHE